MQRRSDHRMIVDLEHLDFNEARHKWTKRSFCLKRVSEVLPNMLVLQGASARLLTRGIKVSATGSWSLFA
jgi:hypothetical protein